MVCDTVQDLREVPVAFHYHSMFVLTLHSIHCLAKSGNKPVMTFRRAEKRAVSFTCLFQLIEETNDLHDGSLINLGGAALLWRSHEGLKKSPVSW